MATQVYSPQNGAPPMRPSKFVADALPAIVAIASIPGRMVPSTFGASEVVFDLTDGRPWYVPQVIADEIYARGIAARQQIEVVSVGRKKSDLRITPLQANLGPTPARRSDSDVREAAPSWQRTAAPAPVESAAAVPTRQSDVTASPVASRAAVCMMAAMCSAVDAVIETQAYATRKGLGLTFSEESVRAIGLSIYIDSCRSGGAR